MSAEFITAVANSNLVPTSKYSLPDLTYLVNVEQNGRTAFALRAHPPQASSYSKMKAKANEANLLQNEGERLFAEHQQVLAYTKDLEATLTKL